MSAPVSSSDPPKKRGRSKAGNPSPVERIVAWIRKHKPTRPLSARRWVDEMIKAGIWQRMCTELNMTPDRAEITYLRCNAHNRWVVDPRDVSEADYWEYWDRRLVRHLKQGDSTGPTEDEVSDPESPDSGSEILEDAEPAPKAKRDEKGASPGAKDPCGAADDGRPARYASVGMAVGAAAGVVAGPAAGPGAGPATNASLSGLAEAAVGGATDRDDDTEPEPVIIYRGNLINMINPNFLGSKRIDDHQREFIVPGVIGAQFTIERDGNRLVATFGTHMAAFPILPKHRVTSVKYKITRPIADCNLAICRVTVAMEIDRFTIEELPGDK